MLRKPWVVLVLAVIILSVAGCGGGGGSSQASFLPSPTPTPTPTPQPPAPFILSFNASEVAVAPGGASAATLQTIATGPGTTNYSLQFAATGLPSGITASFSPNPAPVSTQVTMTVNAAANASLIQNLFFSIAAT